MALLYYDGDGVQKNLDQAFQWMKKAAEQKLPPAQYQLALMYLKGEGVDSDASQALYWLRQAAEQGYPPAQEALDLVESD